MNIFYLAITLSPLDSFSGSGGFSVDLGMIEFFTEWKTNDPKWLIIIILVGLWSIYNYKNHIDTKKQQDKWHNHYMMRIVFVGVVIIIFTISLLWRLFQVI